MQPRCRCLASCTCAPPPPRGAPHAFTPLSSSVSTWCPPLPRSWWTAASWTTGGRAAAGTCPCSSERHLQWARQRDLRLRSATALAFLPTALRLAARVLWILLRPADPARARPALASSWRRGKDGEVDWDAVIDVEMARRKLLEDSPIPCSESPRPHARVSLCCMPARLAALQTKVRACKPTVHQPGPFTAFIAYQIAACAAPPPRLQPTRSRCCLTRARSPGGRGCAASTCPRRRSSTAAPP